MSVVIKVFKPMDAKDIVAASARPMTARGA